MKHLNIKTDLPEEFINRPFEKLLNGTEKAIEQLLDTQKDRSKFTILTSPTGSGKSFIQDINIREYILIFLSSTIFLFFIHEKSFSKENLFTVNNVEVQGVLDLNFNREKYINKAFINSFKVLMKKILLTRDLNKVNNIKLKDVKNFVDSFQILEENYNQDEYKLKIKILYNENKIKKFLSQKNISFSQPDNISVIFYPVFFDGGEMKNFNENYFYEMWTEVKINNEVINFVLPLEDLEDISKIIEIKDRIEEINVGSFVNKYNIKDYVFALMDFQNDKLSIHLKIPTIFVICNPIYF